MKPFILGFYICLACRVHSAMVRMETTTGSEIGSGVGYSGSGSTSVMKMSPGTQELYEREQVRKLAKESHLKDDQHQWFERFDHHSMEGRKTLRDGHKTNRRKTQQVSPTPTTTGTTSTTTADNETPNPTTMTAPTQPRMDRTEYTPKQIQHIERKANRQKRGRDYYYYPAADNFVPISKDCGDVSGYCGRMRIYDSIHNDQLLYDTGCCHCGPCLSNKERPEAEKWLDCAVLSGAAACVGSLYGYCKYKSS